MRLATLLLLISSLGLAKSWTGVLVDSNCYANEQTNVGKDQTTVDRDMNTEVRYCSATPRTKVFAVVLPNWTSLKFDSAGDTRAANVVRKATRNSLFEVTVTGDLRKDTIQVGSMSARQIKTPQ